MKIKDLPRFSFNIGNTLEDEYDVVATNEGISVNGEIKGGYEDIELESGHDLIDAIYDAIEGCDEIAYNDKLELGDVLYNDAALDIMEWCDEEKIFN